MHIARLQRAAKGGSGVILSTVQVAVARAAVRQQRRRAVGHDCIAAHSWRRKSIYDRTVGHCNLRLAMFFFPCTDCWLASLYAARADAGIRC